MKLIWTPAIILLWIIQVKAANILAIFPSDYKSHFTLGRVLFAELASRGHQITLISQFSLGKSGAHENITEIKLDGVKEHFHQLGLEQDPYVAKDDYSIITEIINLIYGTSALVDYTLGYPKLQEIINVAGVEAPKFDLLLLDMYFTDGLLGLAHYWQIPAVVLSSTGTNKWTNEMVGNPHNPAYNPSIFLRFTDKMSLKERLVNALASAFEKITYNYMYLPSQELTYQRYFEKLAKQQGRTLPPLIDLIHNVSLVLVNSHPALQYPRPYTPNMLHIGGAHIRPDRLAALSQDITDYIDAAPDGCIFVSLGTRTKSSDLPAEQIAAFAAAFQHYSGRLRVIWKWENATLLNHPKNVIIGPWMPQAEILANPNVKLFITSAGSLSLLEAVDSATPIVAIPIYGDQHFNAALAEHKRIGRRIDLNNITEMAVREAIDAIVYAAEADDSYAEQARRMQQLFRDNVVDPLDNAVYAIEYVLRTNGAAHLRSAAVDLSMWQQSMVDVSLIITAGILLIIAVPSMFICLVLRKTNTNVVGGGGGGGGGSGTPRSAVKKSGVVTTPKRQSKKKVQ